MKRVDTMVIEKVLLSSCFGSNPKLATDYGTTEVTLNVFGITEGRELVDFLSWNPKKDIYKCYEIKVTMSDFHSDAKKSWYGNYNYLVISKELYLEQTLDEWKCEVPSDVGIIVINLNTLKKETVKKASKRDISLEIRMMLKDSLLRTLFYQNQNDNFYLRGDIIPVKAKDNDKKEESEE
ncbi:MAG: hypothetical protein E7222_13135 [Clostridiales bacterium]|nr:hypothetical protein [Clostridiales bacterium]